MTLSISDTQLTMLCCYAECHILFTIMPSVAMPSVIMLTVNMLSVVILSVIMLNVVMMSVIMLSVVSPILEIT